MLKKPETDLFCRFKSQRVAAWLIHVDLESAPLGRLKYAHKSLILTGVDDNIDYAGQHNHCRMQVNSISIFI